MKPINVAKAIDLYRKIRGRKDDVALYGGIFKDTNDERYNEKKALAEAEAENLEKELATLPCYMKFESALDEVQNRCTARTVDAEYILRGICRFNNELNITKKAMNGVTVRINLNAQSFPNAYKYTPEATIVTVRAKNGNFYIDDISRDRCGTNVFEATLTDEAKAAIIARFEKF